MAPALYHADAFALVPRIDSPGYIPTLAALVGEHDVKLIVPLTDLDQMLLAQSRDALAPALALVPEPEVCRDDGRQVQAHLFFEADGIASPRSWLPDDVPDDARYPLLVKVREGFGSRHIYRANDRAELDFFLGYTTVDSFVQELCQGEEFSVDVFCDFESTLPERDPRTMIQSKGGESIKGMSIKDWELIEHGAQGRRDRRHRRAGEHPVLPRARRVAAGDRRQPAFRRRVPAAARRRQPLPRARARSSRTASGRSRRWASSARAS